ncbi:MAG: glycosyltransferase family 2 protein [Acidobacteria bacterium]|nr:glycosyltransferase family 2 protein [Acidobacteriota bacterium]MBI3657901.1 glycosyltransferase family 2 protein [Acidobacteriota bacterium]
MPLVSVIILNWNGKKLLAACLDALAAQTFRDFEVVLLDNGSRDGSAEYVRSQYPWVRLVESSFNLGFAGGNNRALLSAQGELIVTLNNDTQVVPEFVQALVDAASTDPRIGMVAAKMVNFYDHRKLDSMGIRAAPNAMGYNIGVGEMDHGQYDAVENLLGPCAGAALYRRALLEEVGFFDDDFFAYYEDLDLAWRARLAGWKCALAPAAVVYHIHSATGGRGSPFAVYHIQRNKWYALVKNWPASLIFRKLLNILAYDVASFMLAIYQGAGGAAVRARWDALRHLRALMGKRRKAQALHKVSADAARRLLSPSESMFQTFKRKARESGRARGE